MTTNLTPSEMHAIDLLISLARFTDAPADVIVRHEGAERRTVVECEGSFISVCDAGIPRAHHSRHCGPRASETRHAASAWAHAETVRRHRAAGWL